MLLWSVLALICTLGVVAVIDGALQTASSVAPSPVQAYRLIAAWAKPLTLADSVVLLLAGIAMRLALSGLAITVWKTALIGAKMAIDVARNPRFTGSAGVAVLIGAVYGLPPWQAAMFVGGAVVAYTIIELHTAGTLAKTITASLKFSLLAVTVVISFTIHKLPQLTAAEVAQAATAYRIGNNLATPTDYVWMAGSFLWKGLAAYASFHAPTAGVVAVGAQVAQTLLV
jgi:hypothetical protein